MGSCTAIEDWEFGYDSDSSDSEDSLDLSRLSFHDHSKSRPKPQAMAMKSLNKYWQTGKVLRIRCIGGERSVRQSVISYAKIWEDYANIEFKFVTKEPSHIRISFDKSSGSHSLVGTDAEKLGSSEATMNLAVSLRTSDRDLKCTVLHEFGHVLGCVHEHSSPAGGIKWDRKAVYAHYRKTSGWSKEKLDHNVLKKYNNGTVTQFSEFDPYSIMIYEIPSHLTTNSFSVGTNSDLSRTDKKFIAKIYPKESTRRREGQTSGQGTGNRQGQWPGQGSGTSMMLNPVCNCPQCQGSPVECDCYDCIQCYRRPDCNQGYRRLRLHSNMNL